MGAITIIHKFSENARRSSIKNFLIKDNTFDF